MPGYEDNLLEFFYEEYNGKILKGSIISENCHGVGHYKIYFSDLETTLEKLLVEAAHDTVSFNKNNKQQIDITTWDYDQCKKIHRSTTVNIKDLDVCFIPNMYDE